MKIVGLTYYDGTESIVLKSDSSMLVNRKPLFVPEWINELEALPCWVLRVSRLGKCIAPRFADRYYDAVAAGVDFFGADKLREANSAVKPWTEAIAFENSLAIGEWDVIAQSQEPKVESGQPKVESTWTVERGGEVMERIMCSREGMSDLFAQAVVRVSALVTIRQGDLIYVAQRCKPWRLESEDIICCTNAMNEVLYCKIK